MRFEAHPLRARRFVSRETRNDETQTALSCIGEPQRAGVGVTGRGSAARPVVQSTAPPHE